MFRVLPDETESRNAAEITLLGTKTISNPTNDRSLDDSPGRTGNGPQYPIWICGPFFSRYTRKKRSRLIPRILPSSDNYSCLMTISSGLTPIAVPVYRKCRSQLVLCPGSSTAVHTLSISVPGFPHAGDCRIKEPSWRLYGSPPSTGFVHLDCSSIISRWLISVGYP